MSGMEIIFLILLFLVGGTWEAGAISVTGNKGEEITITCTHSNAFTNEKYFCKDPCNAEDVLISSREQREDSQGKYKIQDKGNTFTVTISDLTDDDSGTFWCGINRVGLDTYNKVVLTVIANVLDPGNVLTRSTSKTLVYIGTGLGVVVLGLATSLLIFFRYRNRNISASPVKDHNTVYATPSSLKQDVKHVTNDSSTANINEDTGSRTNTISSSSACQPQDTNGAHKDNFHSMITISSEAQNVPFYSTVNYSRTPDNRTVTPGPAAVTYSTLAQISADEAAVYHNV